MRVSTAGSSTKNALINVSAASHRVTIVPRFASASEGTGSVGTVCVGTARSSADSALINNLTVEAISGVSQLADTVLGMQGRIAICNGNRHVFLKPGPGRAMLANVRAESGCADANLLELAKRLLVVANVDFALLFQLPYSQAGNMASCYGRKG